MTKQQIIKEVAARIQKQFSEEGTGHDWHHIERVWKNAKKIAAAEKGVDIFVVELSALLHELGDYKLEPDGVERHAQRALELLSKFPVGETTKKAVAETVSRISFSSNFNTKDKPGLEAQVVQDADRLEALGAIGIARIFTVGGSRSRPVYDPKIKPVLNAGLKQYKKLINTGTSINHFYEKILKLKGRMNTKTGRKLAARRHKFVENYLIEFFKEWKGEI